MAASSAETYGHTHHRPGRAHSARGFTIIREYNNYMKKILLLKQVDHIQLGHLYEHIFCTQLVERFRQKGLFAYVDYYIDAKTYYTGVVRVQLDVFTSQAENALKIVQNRPLRLSEDEISGALLQIMAEKYADVSTFDGEYIKSKLHAYHNKPWQELGSVDSIGAPNIRHSDKNFKLHDRSKRHFAILRQTIEFDNANIGKTAYDPIPLFVVVSKALRSNLQEDVASNSYCFTYDDTFRRATRVVEDINLYRIDKRQATKLTTETETTRELLKNMSENGFVERLTEFLQHATLKGSFLCPDEEEIIRNTGVLVGLTYWHRINQDDIRKMLKSITIDYKLGKSKQAIVLKEFFS